MRSELADQRLQPVRNLATNPGFETAGAVTTVRTNGMPNPAVASTAGVYGTGVEVAVGAGFVQATVLTVHSSTGLPRVNMIDHTLSAVVVPGDPYYIRAEVRHSRGTDMQLRTWFNTSDGTYVTNEQGSVLPTSSTSWTDLVMTGTVPATATRMGYQIIGNATADPSVVGATFDFRRLTTDSGTYFDGSTPAAGDFTYAWAGTENASASVQQALAVAGMTGGWQSGEWATSGTKSLHVPDDGTATLSLTTSSTAIVTARNAGQQLTVGESSVTSPAADQPVRATGETLVTLGPGWWDKLLIVEGVYVGDYGDGNTPGWRWDGDSEASTSTGYPSLSRP